MDINDKIFEIIIKRSRILLRDSKNAATNYLTLLTGIAHIRKSSDIVDADLDEAYQKLGEAYNQLGKTIRDYQGLRELIAVAVATSEEADKMGMIKLVETVADTALFTEQLGEVFKLQHVDCAVRMLQLDAELIPWAIKELESYEGGPERIAEWRKALAPTLPQPLPEGGE